MLSERQQLQENEAVLAKPSRLWSLASERFEYVLTLPERFLLDIRYHTWHLTGDNYQLYLFNKDYEAFLVKLWNYAKEGLPSSLLLSEPKGLISGIGFNFDGRLVSLDIVRYQHVVKSLNRERILALLSSKNRKIVLEIGGGYGGLAHHLTHLCSNVTYVIVDLPETLFFSAIYLSLLNPTKKVYIYTPETFEHVKRCLWDFDFLNPELSA